MIENREVGPRGHAVFTPLFNLAMAPGISIPCGTGRDGDTMWGVRAHWGRMVHNLAPAQT